MRARWLVGGVAVLTVAAALVVARTADAAVTSVIRVSTDSAGVQGPYDSWEEDVNRDGTRVAFVGNCPLHPSCVRFSAEIFVKNTTTGQLELVSANTSGAQANSSSMSPSISADGRYVTFTSSATDLVPNDTNGFADVFRRDLVNRTTELVSVASNGDQSDLPSVGSTISADGRYVAFASQGTNLPDGTPAGNVDQQVYLRDMVAATTVRVSQTAAGTSPNGTSSYASISEDGRFVAYSSRATDIATPDANSTDPDIYWFDSAVRTTTRVSVNNAGVQADARSSVPAISGNGRYVAFASLASNLGLSNPNRTQWHVYVRDITLQTTDRISLDSNYRAANALSYGPSISADGRYVAFYSDATNLVPLDNNGAADVFVRDRVSKTTVRVSVTATGGEANSHSYSGLLQYTAAISSDATVVAFDSVATNVVTPDSNGTRSDVYLAPVPGAVAPTPRPSRTEPSPTRSDPTD